MTNEAVVELLSRIGVEIRWITAKWLLSDVFNVTDAECTTVLGELVDKGLVKHDRGWIRVA